MNAKKHPRLLSDQFSPGLRRVQEAVRRVLAVKVEPAPGGSRWVSQSIGADSRGPERTVSAQHHPLDFAYRRVTAEEARRELPLPPPPPAARAEPARRQPRGAPEPLTDASIAWLARVPEAVRPIELPRQFPRILNQLCRYWRDPAGWDQYLGSLLIDSRDGSRAGFPPKVAAELAKLFSIHSGPQSGKAWDDVSGR